MKKSWIIILSLSIFAIAVASALCVIIPANPSTQQCIERIEQAIIDTNSYMQTYEVEDELFGNILQSNLKSSLVYDLEDNETLILYKGREFVYKDCEVSLSQKSFNIFNNVEQALVGGEIGEYVLTRGYNKAFDGGNSLYLVCPYFQDLRTICISNKEEDKTLQLVDINQTINIFQMGYTKGEISGYVNSFIKEYSYKNIFIPKGRYRVCDNFDVSVGNKSFYGFKTTIYSDNTYLPQGASNGCLFYVYNNISNVYINGFDVKVIVKKKLNDPLIGLMTARDVQGVTLNNCSFYLPKEGRIYSVSGMIDLFTGWQDVTVKNCRLENFSSTVGGGGIGVRDIFKKECRNALFENNYIYSNCKDEMIAIFSGIDTSLYEDKVGGGNIQNVTFKNNTIVGGKPNADIETRVVGITVGYQVSPVSDIKFINNDITMYSANYLLIYGKTKDLIFEGNDCKLDSSYQADLYTLFWHNVKADAGEGILIKNNSFLMLENSTIRTLALTGEELAFVGNTFTSSYKVSRLMDCHSIFENNVFNVDNIGGCVYRDIKNVKNNRINAQFINVVFEFFDLNIQNDIVIYADHITTNSIGSNFMMFNGNAINFNNHSLTFHNFVFETSVVLGPYYYLAHGTTQLCDRAVINFINSDLSVYNDGRHNFVANDNGNKVTINFTSTQSE